MGWWNRVLVGTISLDLVCRAAAEVIGLGEAAGLSTVLILGGRLALGLEVAGWAFGWLLFWLLVFRSTPLFFPRQGPPELDWTNGLANRLLLATAAVGAGVTLEGWLAVAETRFNVSNVVTAPVVVSPSQAGSLLALTLVGYVAARKVPKTRISTQYLSTPASRYDDGVVTADRYLLLVLVLGAVLAIMAVLFPLPELVLLGIQAADLFLAVGFFVTSAEYVAAIRSDLVEGITGAVLVVWGSLEDVFHLVYVLAPLLFFWYVAVNTVGAVNAASVAASTPLALVTLLLCLVAAGIQVTFYAVRLGERIRDGLVGTQQSVADEGGMTAMAPRIPLVLLPAGLAMFSLFGMIAIQEQRRPSETVFFLSDLPFVPELGALTVVAFVLSVLTVSRPAWFPILDISDHTAAPLATTVVFMSIVSTAVVYLGASLDPSFAVGLGAVTVLVFGPWLGSRVLLGPKSATEWDRLTTGVRNAGLVTVVSLGGSWFIYDAYGGTFPESLGFLAAILVAIIGVGVTSLVLFVFLLPFHYRSRGR